MDLLEREREIAAFDAVLEGGGPLVIEGGAGIGKTSLLGLGCERAGRLGQEVLRARGSELESGFAFGVVRQLFERRMAVAGTEELAWMFAGPASSARHLFFAAPAEAIVSDNSFAVLHGLYWLAVNMAMQGPVLIAVDDADWVDAPSLRWPAYLAPRLEGLALALVVTLRPKEPASTDAALVALREPATVVRPCLLGESAVTLVVRGALGEEATDDLCLALKTASGGNPFYLSELLRGIDHEATRVAEVDPAELVARGGQGVDRERSAVLSRSLSSAIAVACLSSCCPASTATSDSTVAANARPGARSPSWSTLSATRYAEEHGPRRRLDRDRTT